jgi:hypothetical protein
MKKTALVMAAVAAVCFTLTGAEAAKKKAAPKKPADVAYEWNLKNLPPGQGQMADINAPKKAAPAAKKHKKGHKMAHHKKGHKKMGKKKG